MLRALALATLLATGLASAADAQRAQPRMAAQAEEVESDLCQISQIAFANGGVGFVCAAAGSPRFLIASDGGNRPGGVSALMSFLTHIRDRSGSTRNGVNVRHSAPSPAIQQICDDLAMPGPTNRQPMTCRELVSAYH